MLCQTRQALIFSPRLTISIAQFSHRQIEHAGETYHFCSDGCHDAAFAGEPDK